MDLYEYQRKFKTLISRERTAEMEFHTNEIKSLSADDRERKGRTITGLIRQQTKHEHESIFRFVKKNNQQFHANEFSVGCNVIISVDDPLRDGCKGIVHGKSQVFIDVYVPNQSNILNKTVRIDIHVNDTTYNNQISAIDSMKDMIFEKGEIVDILLHKKKPKLSQHEEVEFFDESLNPSQKHAVNQSMKEEQFYLIQGPPGTGKTKTSIEIIRQHLKEKKKVLVAADSNMAVDNIMLGLLKHVPVVRLGESPKILKEIQDHTFSNLIKEHFQYRVVDKGMENIKKMREQQRKEMVPNKKNSHGLSHFQIIKLAERGQEDFGISEKDMRSMAEWIKLQNEIKLIQKRIDKIKVEIIHEMLSEASVICCTNTNANSDYLDKIDFDLVLIDEAGQSTEPSCIIPVIKGKKIILVGDHKQLPPTILSQDAKELSISLFERMIPKLRHTLLDVQYRMHPLINQFPSDTFYDGKIKSDKSTSEHNIPSDVFVKNVAFIECFGKERKFKGATSYHNFEEVKIIEKLADDYVSLGIKKEDIGIISPYAGQVRKLQEEIPFIEVNTIDGFQGREKRIIIISLTRSNARKEIGFLKDLRRLNVALTRARDELIVVGNPDTISSEKTYADFIEFCKKDALYLESDYDKKKQGLLGDKVAKKPWDDLH